jgi:5-methylcytosine-specific restriction endonuclease McrA
MPNINTKACVLVRDRFTCRYCGNRLYLAQAVKVLDMHNPGEKHWDAHWGNEPLKSDGATVDHIVPEDEGGYDTLDNLVACCVVCNSSKGNRPRNLLPRFTDKKWDGGSSLFLTLSPMYRQQLSREDEKWLKVLRREGIAPDEENIRGRMNDLQLGI